MKIKVIDPKGLRLPDKKNIPVGEVFEQPKGPQLDAWLRFKQVEPAKEKPAREEAGDSEKPKPAATPATAKGK